MHRARERQLLNLVSLVVTLAIWVTLARPARAGQFSQIQTLNLPGDGNPFVIRTLALDGDTAIVSTNNGTYAFVADLTGQWSQQGQLTSAYGQVDLSGDTAILYESSTLPGRVSVFTRSGGVWSQQQVILPSDASTSDDFGRDAHIEGDFIVSTSAKNLLYIFQRVGGVWTQSDEYSHTKRVRGISSDSLLLTGQGSAEIWRFTGSDYVPGALFGPPDHIANSTFGNFGAIAGDVAVVAALTQGSPNHTTILYAYQRVAGTWNTTTPQILSAPVNTFPLLGDGFILVTGNELSGVSSSLIFERGTGGWTQTQTLGPAQAASVGGLALFLFDPQKGTQTMGVYDVIPRPHPISAPTATNPPAVVGDGQLTQFVPPQTVAFPNGFALSGMSATVTSTSTTPVTLTWDAEQAFDLSDAVQYGASIDVETTVSIAGSGTASYVVSSLFDSIVVTQAPAPAPTLSGTTPVSFHADPQTYTALFAGTHLFHMRGTLVFNPAAPGESITFSSTYNATPLRGAAVVTPAPALPFPLAIALGLSLLGLGLWRSKSAQILPS